MFDSSSSTQSEYGGETITNHVAEHQLIDRRLCGYAAQRAALDAAESFDLVRAFTLKLHFTLGFATFLEYMERRLGYMPHTARERLRVARCLVTLPLTSAELARGALTYSHLRELTRVATPETEEAWLAAAAEKTAGEVQELVAGHVPGDLPTDRPNPDLRPRRMQLELPPEVHALWRQTRRALAEERGGEVTDADVMETVCRSYLAPGSGADRPAHQISFQQCGDCKRAAVNGAGRMIDVRRAVFERACCDARNIGDVDAASPARATTTVTARMREQVFSRDHERCVVPGCRSSRNLAVHHLIAQAEGGPHALWNLTLLCSGHHTALHDGLLVVTGRAEKLAFRWTYGRPLAPGLSGEARVAAIRATASLIFGEEIEKEEPDVMRRRRRRRARQDRGVVGHVPAGTRDLSS